MWASLQTAGNTAKAFVKVVWQRCGVLNAKQAEPDPKTASGGSEVLIPIPRKDFLEKLVLRPRNCLGTHSQPFSTDSYATYS